MRVRVNFPAAGYPTWSRRTCRSLASQGHPTFVFDREILLNPNKAVHEAFCKALMAQDMPQIKSGLWVKSWGSTALDTVGESQDAFTYCSDLWEILWWAPLYLLLSSPSPLHPAILLLFPDSWHAFPVCGASKVTSPSLNRSAGRSALTQWDFRWKLVLWRSRCHAEASPAVVLAGGQL